MNKIFKALIVTVIICSVCLSSLACGGHTHTVVVDEAVAATCVSVGKTEGSHCSTCGEIIVAQEEISKLIKHNFGDEWENDENYHWRKCLQDGCKVISSKISHVDEQTFIPATGLATGKEVKKCTVCGNIRETVIPMKKFDKATMTINYTTNFKIVQITDIHGRSRATMQQTFSSLIDKTINSLKPDLIILTGDNVDLNSTKDTFTCLVENMEKFKIPWAPIFGNHDNENNNGLTKTYMSDVFGEAEYCLFEKGNMSLDSIGNYYIKLKKNNLLKYNIICLDSNTYKNGPGSGYDAIHNDQVSWYESVVNSTKVSGQVIPSLLFFHIPLHEFADALSEYTSGQSFPVTLPNGMGVIGENVCAPSVDNTGMFAKVKELGSTKAIFCGHDHKSYCDVEYQGVRLNYGLCSARSDNAYRPPNERTGVKLITINENDTFDIENIFFDSI